MKEERMFILNMLKEGKISADEACKLMSALKGSSGVQTSEIGEKVTGCAKTIKDKVTKIAKDAEPTVKKYAGAVGEKLDVLKDSLKNKTAKPSDNEDDIIVDNTEEEIIDESIDEAADEENTEA